MTLREWAMSVRDEYGKLTPEIVREAARPEDSPVHAFVFNVPPGEAAEEHYLQRAHKLIQTVRVARQIAPNEPPRRVRFFHAVTDEEEDIVYEPLTVLVQHPDKLAEVRKAAVRRLRDAESAVSDLDLLATDRAQRDRSTKALKTVREARELIEAP